MNAFHESDVYPVDVSTTPSHEHKNHAPSPISHARIHVKSAEYTRHLLSNPDFQASNFYIYASQYDPVSLQYMLEFFRNVAQSMPSRSPSPSTDTEALSVDPMPGSAQQMLQDRAGIIVLREDLDYYVIPPKRNIEQAEMVEVKRAAGRALLRQDGIFSGLRKSEETGSTEQHLIEMLTAGSAPTPSNEGPRG